MRPELRLDEEDLLRELPERFVEWPFVEFPVDFRDVLRDVLRCDRDPEDLLRGFDELLDFDELRCDLDELPRVLADLLRDVLRCDPEDPLRDLDDLLRDVLPDVLLCDPEELLLRELLLREPLLLPLLRDDELLRDGTFAPSLRASESPMAMACFGFVTFLPLRPMRSLPCFISCISSWTFSCAFGPYFLPPVDLCDDELRLVAIPHSPFPDWEAAQDEEVARRDACTREICISGSNLAAARYRAAVAGRMSSTSTHCVG